MSPQIAPAAPAGIAALAAALPSRKEPPSEAIAGGEAGMRPGDALFQALVEQIPAITYIEHLGDTDTYAFMSPQVETILGVPASEVVANPGLFADSIHPDDLERVRLEGERTTRTGEPFRMEYRIQARDGRWVWLRNEAVLIRDDTGRPLHWLGVALDITGQREAEAALRESEERFRALVQHSFDVITVIAPDGTRRYVSPSIEPVLGYPPDSLIGGNVLDLVHPKDAERLRTALARCLDGKRQTPVLDLRFRHRDGGWREFEAIGTNLLHEPAVAGIVFNSREVTARKAAEVARRESEERFRTLFEAAGIATALVDARGAIQIANPAFGAFLGYGVAELGGMTNEEITHPDDRNLQRELRHRMWRGALDSYQLEKRYLRRDGAVVWGLLHTTAVRDAAGEVVAALGQIQDITDRKTAETALRASEELFRAVHDHAPIGFAIVSPDGRFRQVNPALCQMLGYAEHELLGQTFQDITHPDDLADDLAQAERLFGGEIASYELEKRYLHKDGHAVWVHLTGSAVYDADGPRYGIALIQEVTGRRHLEMERAIMLASEREYNRQLRELTEMRTDLSAIVAHELNTPVAAIKLMTTMLATKELTPQEEATTFAAISDQLGLLDRLVADFAAAAAAERDDFSVQLHPVPLAVLLAGATAFAQTTLNGRPFAADAASTVRASTVRVWCDPERIGQVLQNLLENAAKHTPAGTPVALRVRDAGDWVRIEIADQGPGILAADLRLIFEKFGRARDTARQETPGAGLGLYVARGIVEAHGSELTVASAPGNGTVFAFDLKVAP